jgi:uncharacterized protein DUF6919
MNENTEETASPEAIAESEALWAAARTLADLGELTAQWLEGKIAFVPSVVPGHGPDEETGDLIPVLAACNRAGFVTHQSQPGEEPAPGHDGQMWVQRASVMGFAATATLDALRAQTAGTRLLLIAAPTDSSDRHWETQVCVTMDGDRENTWFGGQLARADIDDEVAGYGGCHPDAVEAILRAWEVTIIDPEWGRNDVLWPALQAFADAAQHMTTTPGGPST